VAKTVKKRRRKHRGTQSGRVDRAARRPRSRQEARAQLRSRQGAKRDMPPTWAGAARRAVLAAFVFFALIAFIFKQPIGAAIGLSTFMLAVYIPMGYFFDSFLYRRRHRD
jgi:hypothetical protein